MSRWHSSHYPVADIRDWSERHRLELRPDFQRRPVWSLPAKVMLIDSILKGIPMPLVLSSNTVKNGQTYRIVFDGQQRLAAILGFLRDEFSLGKPYSGEGQGKRFSELPPGMHSGILGYQIDFSEAVDLTEAEVREAHARVNKYTVPLNRQETRRADFPGDFLKLAERLAADGRLASFGLFTPAQRRRHLDVEYVSEILAAMIAGVQHRQATLDDFYMDFAQWGKEDRERIGSAFLKTAEDIEALFAEGPASIAETRFSQKADFYTLFLATHALRQAGGTIEGKRIRPLREDLRQIEKNIHSASPTRLCDEYALKCVVEAHTSESRR